MKSQFLNALTNFLGNPEGLSENDLVQSLEDAGINVPELLDRLEQIKLKYLPSQPDCSITGEGKGQGYERPAGIYD